MFDWKRVSDFRMQAMGIANVLVSHFPCVCLLYDLYVLYTVGRMLKKAKREQGRTGSGFVTDRSCQLLDTMEVANPKGLRLGLTSMNTRAR